MARNHKVLYALLEIGRDFSAVEFNVLRKGVDGKYMVQGPNMVRMLVDSSTLKPSMPIYGKKLYATHREMATAAKELAAKRLAEATETLKYWREKSKLAQRDVLTWMGVKPKPNGKANAERESDAESVHDERAGVLVGAGDQAEGAFPGLLLGTDAFGAAGSEPHVAVPSGGGTASDAPDAD